MPSAVYVSGVIAYPGVDIPIFATVSRVTGVRPSVALIYAVPQAGTPDCGGNATFTFGSSSNTITMNRVLCDAGTLQVTSRGRRQIFTLLDRRWRWSKAYVTGAYNVYDPSGNIISATQKTLAQLATILFTAMGESGADVSLITSTEKPEVVYEYDNAADAIADLLESRGYVICLLANDSVKVFPRGTGTPLPVNDDLVSANISIDPPEIPLTLQAVAERTMVQSMLKCLAVGKDTDGKIKLTKDLSYNPGGVGNANGWDGMDLETMAFIADPIARQLALDTVGRWYQVASQADGTQNFGDYIPGEIAVTSGFQYLPVKKFLLDTSTDVFGLKQYKESFVSGTFWDGQTSNPPANIGPFYRLEKTPWTLIEELGIVVFKEPETRYDAGLAKQVFADVYLTCCYSVKDSTTYVHDHFTRNRNLGGIGVDSFKAKYLQRTLIAAYTAGTGTISGITDNNSAVATAADLLLDNRQQQYVTQQSNILLYRDIYAFNTDGVTLQIQWNIATGGQVPIGTMASQYAEMLPLLPTAANLQQARLTRMNGSPMNRRNRKYKNEMGGRRAVGGGFY